MTGPKLTGKAQEALGGNIEIGISGTGGKESKRAQKIAKREAKQAEKIEKKRSKKQAPVQSTEVKVHKTIFGKIEDVISSASTMILGIVGLIELGIGVIGELPEIIKWVVKFVLFSGAFGSKEKES